MGMSTIPVKLCWRRVTEGGECVVPQAQLAQGREALGEHCDLQTGGSTSEHENSAGLAITCPHASCELFNTRTFQHLRGQQNYRRDETTIDSHGITASVAPRCLQMRQDESCVEQGW